MGPKVRKSSTKNPPILSHEFVIQNHADIVSCVAMVFVIGLMVQATSPLAYMFIAIHHNVSSGIESLTPEIPDVIRYTYGLKDLAAIFFYFLIGIVMHAIIQEYILDKITRKLHLSKVKHSLFNESGQLLIFYVLSVLWAGDVIFRENYLVNITSLWESYPHDKMTFMVKFFFIVQLSYWLHTFPELYFQKTKREEMPAKVAAASVAIAYIGAAYLLNFSRVGVCLLALHYGSEALFHVARLVHFVDKTESENKSGYFASNVLFVVVRLGSIILSVLTFWYGLTLSESSVVDFSTGNFNTRFVRLGALGAICLLQAFLMFNFITCQLQKRRELASAARRLRHERPVKVARKKKEEKREDDDLPEVDQNTKKSLHQRKTAGAVTKAKSNHYLAYMDMEGEKRKHKLLVQVLMS